MLIQKTLGLMLQAATLFLCGQHVAYAGESPSKHKMRIEQDEHAAVIKQDTNRAVVSDSAPAHHSSVFPGSKPGSVFKDCPDCPDIVVIPIQVASAAVAIAAR
jgi:hypothetical protein